MTRARVALSALLLLYAIPVGIFSCKIFSTEDTCSAMRRQTWGGEGRVEEHRGRLSERMSKPLP